MSIISEAANHTGFDLFKRTNIQQLLQMLGRHSQHHAFLCLREPYFPGSESLVLERGICQFDTGPCLRAHFTNCRREATSATVGNGRVELAIPGLYKHICDFFLCNRCSDLYDTAGLCINVVAHLSGREGSTVYAVSPGTPADDNDAIAWLDVIGMASMWKKTYAATEDERIEEIALIIEDGTVDGGNAHLVAVVTYAADHSTDDATWRECTWRQLLHRCVGRPKTE